MVKDISETLELSLFVDAVKQHYGYDLSQYKSSSLSRRIKDLVRKNSLSYISELIPYVFYKSGFYEELMTHISVGVSDFFRDPLAYKVLMKQLLDSELINAPHLNIWCAGCSTGEEAYSLAILLKELDLFNKTQITATDLCLEAIESAKKGIYSNGKVQHYSTNYQKAGGCTSFNYYFNSRYQWIKINQEFINSISFQQHNLLHDDFFKDQHLIVCRNVLIYFAEDVQERLFRLFSQSLVNGGLLFLGPQDSLYSLTLSSSFTIIDEKLRLYRKR